MCSSAILRRGKFWLDSISGRSRQEKSQVVIGSWMTLTTLSHIKNALNIPANKRILFPSERKEIKRIIKNKIYQEANSTYQTSIYCKRWASKISPQYEKKCKNYHISRKMDTIITRIKLDKCPTNLLLHRIQKKLSPLCDFCPTPETVEHVLLHCPQYANARQRCNFIPKSIDDLIDVFRDPTALVTFLEMSGLHERLWCLF